MILECGNMWDVFGKTDLFLITTNPIRRKDGAVVMGRGIALEAKQQFPRLPFEFGEALQRARHIQDNEDALHPLNIGIISSYAHQLVGWFMVKDHWREPAKLSVIERSVEQLKRSLRPEYRADLNFPGIGNGKLKREDVLPLLQVLPDNVHIWELP